MYQLKTEAHFDSAHFLADYYGTCENLHGHRWRVVVYIEQEHLQTDGTMRDMVCDFGVFKKAVREVAAEYDHTFLVEEGTLSPATVTALEEEGFTLKMLPVRTTAEILAKLFFWLLRNRDLPVVQVDMYETPNNCAVYHPSSEAVAAFEREVEACVAAGTDINAAFAAANARRGAAGAEDDTTTR